MIRGDSNGGRAIAGTQDNNDDSGQEDFNNSEHVLDFGGEQLLNESDSVQGHAIPRPLGRARSPRLQKSTQSSLSAALDQQWSLDSRRRQDEGGSAALRGKGLVALRLPARAANGLRYAKFSLPTLQLPDNYYIRKKGNHADHEGTRCYGKQARTEPTGARVGDATSGTWGSKTTKAPIGKNYGEEDMLDSSLLFGGTGARTTKRVLRRMRGRVDDRTVALLELKGWPSTKALAEAVHDYDDF
ncbi:hypothetical protein CkaCkLH20_01990 [Colletotrichum karsti]|uniref:Uncharacterized protein n=1 Tax=Colletotrichum karsti TaxID=1095194 RepID=A0A9P6LPC2_9PEZI|nr:uncharacterized protein CkaCkLH20_01990 [Colletotrichum karsti]KAF9880948.1 hypothetical protein CkaCkLH20_01990 [Colletotrichum karsti]